jgi:hypothetical protein
MLFDEIRTVIRIRTIVVSPMPVLAEVATS